MKRQNQLQRMTAEEKKAEYECFWSASNDDVFAPITIAIVLKKSLEWLQKKRCDGDGIPFVKLGHRTIVYKKQDVLEYLEQHKIKHTGA